MQTVVEAPPIKVGLLDDHESVRLGLSAAIRDAGFDLVFTAANADEMVGELHDTAVDVVVLDLSLGDGSSITQNVKAAQAAGAAVLVHSIADRNALLREAIAAGVAGVVRKSAPMADVVGAIGIVATGEVLRNQEWASAVDADQNFTKAQITRRERDVLHLYASGLPLKMVAQELGISFNTAREYLDRVRVKYTDAGRPAPTKVDLLRRAVEDGILSGLDGEEGDVGL